MTCKDGRFNTGNKLCSNDLRDLNDNSIIVDGYVNSKEYEVEDRFGTPRLTLAGIENKVDCRADDAIGRFEGEIDAIIKDAGGVEVVNRWVDSTEKVPSVGFLKGNLGYVTPEMFGAVGDGVTDDTLAVKMALLDGGEVVFSGSYKVVEDLHVSKDIYISGSGEIRFAKGKRLTLGDTAPKETFTLDSPAYITQTYLTKPVGITVNTGDYLEIISSISWYADPRPETTDSKVSEICMVKGLKDDLIILDNPLSNGYGHIQGEIVTVKLYKPSNVYLSGLSVIGDSLDSAITFNYCNVVGSNITTGGFRYSGILLKGCYKYNLRDIDVVGANSSKAGYGIQTLGCAYGKVFNLSTFNCRSGFDDSGHQVISVFNKVINSTFTGGGYTDAGVPFGWRSDGMLGNFCTGVSTHGSSLGFVAEGCSYANLHTVATFLGVNPAAISSTLHGRFLDLFHFNKGFGGMIDGVNYITDKIGFSNTTPPNQANINSTYPESLIVVDSEYKFNNPIKVSGCKVTIRGSVVRGIGTSSLNVNVADSQISFRPLGNTDPVYLFNSVGVKTIVDLTIKGLVYDGRGTLNLSRGVPLGFYDKLNIIGFKDSVNPLVEPVYGFETNPTLRVDSCNRTFSYGEVRYDMVVIVTGIKSSATYLQLKIKSVKETNYTSELDAIGRVTNNLGLTGGCYAVGGSGDVLCSLGSLAADTPRGCQRLHITFIQSTL